eukprot:SAG31_NODE_13729_length_851_cov_0.724734_2_plen_230_part_00
MLTYATQRSAVILHEKDVTGPGLVYNFCSGTAKSNACYALLKKRQAELVQRSAAASAALKRAEQERQEAESKAKAEAEAKVKAKAERKAAMEERRRAVEEEDRLLDEEEALEEMVRREQEKKEDDERRAAQKRRKEQRKLNGMDSAALEADIDSLIEEVEAADSSLKTTKASNAELLAELHAEQTLLKETGDNLLVMAAELTQLCGGRVRTIAALSLMSLPHLAWQGSC